jgi:putative ABC transport system permease protein
MKTSDLVRSAVSNTFRSKLRTTLTVLALFIGAFTLTLTTALGAGVTDYVTKQVASLGASDVLIVSAGSTAAASSGPTEYDPNTSTGSNGAAAPLPGAAAGGALTQAKLDDLHAIDGLSGIEPIKPVSVDYVEASSGDGARYEFSIAPTSSIAKSDLVAGSQLDRTSTERQLILPDEYVSALGFASAKDAVGAPVTIGVTDVLGAQHQVTATLVGISNPSLLSSGGGANTALVDELAAVQSAGVHTPARYSLAIAHFDPNLTATQIDALKAQVASKGMSGQTIADQLGVITTVISGITGVLNAFAIIALLAAAFGIVNTLLMSVQERTREIGLMKAMGMSGGRVFALFSLEAGFIGLLGSLLGVLAAVLVGLPLSSALAAGPLSGLAGLHILLFQPAGIVGVILLIVVIALLAGSLPARRAARKTPIDALRYE